MANGLRRGDGTVWASPSLAPWLARDSSGGGKRFDDPAFSDGTASAASYKVSQLSTQRREVSNLALDSVRCSRAIASTQLGGRAFAVKTRQHDPDLLFRRVPLARCPANPHASA